MVFQRSEGKNGQYKLFLKKKERRKKLKEKSGRQKDDHGNNTIHERGV